MKLLPVFLLFITLSFGQNNGPLEISSASENLKINLQKSSIKIMGTSTLHDWTSLAEQTEANIIFNNYNDVEIEKLVLIVLVESIKNTKGHRLMDKLTRKALKSDDFPKINYVFIKAETIGNQENELKVKLIGNLTIAGKTNKITVFTTINKSSTNVVLKGTHKLKMTDYGVDPPKALLGTVKTGDEITIDFSIKF